MEEVKTFTSTPITSVDEFNNIISNNGNDLLCVRFHADWCMPCKMLGKTIESMEAIDGVQFFDVDVEENDDLTGKYGVQSLPCIIMFKKGEEIYRMLGNQPKANLIEKIEFYR